MRSNPMFHHQIPFQQSWVVSIVLIVSYPVREGFAVVHRHVMHHRVKALLWHCLVRYLSSWNLPRLEDRCQGVVARQVAVMD